MSRRVGAVSLLCFSLLTFLPGCVNGILDGDLRLVGHNSTKKFPAAGRLEVYVGDRWGTVCDSAYSFNQIAADIACKQLGYSIALAYGSVNKLGFSLGSNGAAVKNVNCSSRSTTQLLGCHYWYSSSSCPSYHVIAVRCQHTGNNIRLVTWSGRSNNVSAGRLEVYKDYEWGTICKSGFTYKEATVACRQLGFSDYSAYGTTTSFNLPYASYYVQYFLSGVSCSSTESSLFDCSWNSYSDYSCEHYDSGDTALSCVGTGALRLVDDMSKNQNLPSGGRLEIYLNGNWGTIKYYGMGYTEANVACYQLGFNGVLDYGSVTYIGYSEADSSTPVWVTDLSCPSDANTLLDCSIDVADSSTYYYYHSSDVALRCNSPATTTAYYDPSDSGLSFAALLIIIIGSLVACSFMLVMISLFCVCVACARVKKRQSRRCVQRNVVEESSPYGYHSSPPGYPGSFSSSPRPPPPPYSATDVHAEERARQLTSDRGQHPASGSSMHSVVNFPQNYLIEHEAFYPTTSGQPEIANTTHVAANRANLSHQGLEDFTRLPEPNITGVMVGNEDLISNNSSGSVSEDQPLISDTN